MNSNYKRCTKAELIHIIETQNRVLGRLKKELSTIKRLYDSNTDFEAERAKQVQELLIKETDYLARLRELRRLLIMLYEKNE